MGYPKKAVVAVAPSGKAAGWFESLSDAARVLNGTDGKPDSRNIKYAIIRGTRCGKFHWMWKEDYDNAVFSNGIESLAWTIPDSHDENGKFKKGNKVGIYQQTPEHRAKCSEMMRERWKAGVYENTDFISNKYKDFRYICLETGDKFHTLKEIAEYVDRTPDYVRSRVCQRKPIRGYRFNYLNKKKV